MLKFVAVVWVSLTIPLMAASIVFAQDVLPVATEDYPPYEMEEPVNGLRGFDYEVAKEVFARIGFAIDVQFLPWKRALHYAETGRVAGILTCAYRPERESFLRFSDPISHFTSGFFIRKDHAGPKPRSLHDVAGLAVASITAYESLAASGPTLSPRPIRTAPSRCSPFIASTISMSAKKQPTSRSGKWA